MNAIDEIGQSVDVVRGTPQNGYLGGCGAYEPDAAYATRVLQTLYKSHQSTHGLVWTSDREENHREQWAVTGEFRAYVYRQNHAWWYQVYHAQTGKVLVRGVTGNVDLAQQVCSLALSDQP